MPATIVQITDPHVLADPAGRVAGVPTRETFRAVLAHAAARVPDADWLVLTGDLAQDEMRETYEALDRELGAWRARSLVLPGNHDDPGAIRAMFPEAFAGDSERLVFSVTADGWRLLGLDTNVPGATTGRVDGAQRAWLEAELRAHAGVPTVVFMHHPPLPVGCDWLDALGLEEPEPLLALLEQTPQVRAVVCGHVHMAHEGRIGHARFLTTPSSAFQFAPAGDEKYDPVPPGYRVLDLGDDALDTRVVRLPRLDHPPG